jgi:mannose-1-phosphate guanylyltransferase
MSAIINYSLRVDKLPKEKFVAGKDGAVYINLTMSVNDETRFGNNAAVYVSQTKEENQEKKPKTYLGNGKVVWNNGTIVNAEKEVKEEFADVTEASDFPF